MFFPPKLTTILSVTLALATVSASMDCFAQTAEFEKRAAAMRRARSRGQLAQQNVTQATFVDLNSENSGSTPQAPPQPVARVAQTPIAQHSPVQSAVIRNSQSGARRVVQIDGSASRQVAPTHQRPFRSVTNRSRIVETRDGYVPQHLRTAQLIGDNAIIDGGAPIISDGVIDHGFADQGVIVDHGVVSSFPTGASDQIFVDGQYDSGIIVDQGYASAQGEGCASCGVSGHYFEDGGCCGRGGCPPGPFWLSNLSKALRTGEYFGGAVAFQSPLFTAQDQVDDGDPNNVASDSSFGFFGGFNLGIPLCQLSGGLLSGQFGIRSVNTNFNGNEFTTEERRQTFVTAGLYRRVDYGLQFGVVADILHEEWFTESDLVQIRADIGWVYPAGHTFGFRYATGVQDETTDGTFNGTPFTGLFQTSDDNFRFYYRHAAPWGGWGEGFIGWAESSQTVIGVDVDMPVTEYVAFQSGFTAYLNDDPVPASSNFQGGNLNEGWNIYVGLSFRPQGKAFYKNYDRPLFSVADNGTFLVRRSSPELN